MLLEFVLINLPLSILVGIFSLRNFVELVEFRESGSKLNDLFDFSAFIDNVSNDSKVHGLCRLDNNELNSLTTANEYGTCCNS